MEYWGIKAEMDVNHSPTTKEIKAILLNLEQRNACLKHQWATEDKRDKALLDKIDKETKFIKRFAFALCVFFVVILLLTSLTATSQILGVPIELIKRENPDYIEYQRGDTTVLEFVSRTGHFLFWKFEPLIQEWHFVKGVCVYHERTVSKMEYRRIKRDLRRSWRQEHDVYTLGNRMIWLNPERLHSVKWKRD